MSQSHSHSPFEAKWFGAETQTSHRRTSTAVKSAIAGLILTSTLILLWTLEYNYPRRIPFAKLLPPAISPTSHLIFNEEVVLTYKTGSAVIFNRVPTWLLDLSAARQMPCHHHRGWAEYIPNQAYYSDTATTLGDVTFKDILANVSDYVRGMDDFQEYYRVHQSLLNRVDPAIVAKTAAAANEPIPKGWALDKFKFLPLHGDAYRKWPVAKWQVSIEDDTFVFWNQLLKWLKTQDHDAHRLYGNPTLLVNGSLPFAHGGSVYVLSRGLLKATYGQDPWGFEHRWDHYVRYSCCGDAELSRAMRLATNSSELPNFESSKFKFQADSIQKVKFDARDLCQPIFSLHHVTPFEYSQLQRMKKALDPLVSQDDFVRYIDVWDWMKPTFLSGKVVTTRNASAVSADWHHEVGWRAIARDDVETVPGALSSEQCHERCVERQGCLLYTFDHHTRQCKLSNDLFVGQVDPEGNRYKSGWHVTRINALRARQSCAGRLGDIGVLAAQSIAPSVAALARRPMRA